MLGPILFILYMNDLFLEMKDSSLIMYADDSKIYFCVKNFEDAEKLQWDLEKVSNWAHLWQLDLAPNKTQLLHLGRTNQKMFYTLHNNIIVPEAYIRDLGVLIDENLCSTVRFRILPEEHML